jgi:hypothetical protein
MMVVDRIGSVPDRKKLGPDTFLEKNWGRIPFCGNCIRPQFLRKKVSGPNFFNFSPKRYPAPIFFNFSRGRVLRLLELQRPGGRRISAADYLNARPGLARNLAESDQSGT